MDNNKPISQSDFSQMLDARLSRRKLLKGSLAVAATSYIGAGTLWLTPTGNAQAAMQSLTFNFAAVPKSKADLLAAIPGHVGDGMRKTITNRDGDKERSVTTYVGTPATDDTLRRLLVGPVDCEITGLTESPDGRALFVNIQHPGETTNGKDFNTGNPATWLSHWPAGGQARPRSATIVITRDDGGMIGTDSA